MNLSKQAIQPQEQYRSIPLTKGQFSIVDRADYDNLIRWSWQARWSEDMQNFYANRKGKSGEPNRIYMHREILGLKKGDHRQCDHINGNTLDNRHCNLRVVTEAQNHHNTKTRSDNKCGVKGVYFSERGQKYIAIIAVNGKRIYLGSSSIFEVAVALRKEGEEKYHGEFRRVQDQLQQDLTEIS